LVDRRPNAAVLGAGNVAFSINEHRMIAGQSTLSNNNVWHSVLWQDGVISDLGVLLQDLVGIAASINNKGDVVGASVSAPAEIPAHTSGSIRCSSGQAFGDIRSARKRGRSFAVYPPSSQFFSRNEIILT